MYVILGVFFSIIILLLMSLSCIYQNKNKPNAIIEKFNSMPIKIEDHLCKGEGVFTGINNLYRENAVICVKGQCDQVKCWYMMAVQDEKDMFEFKNDFNHMRIIDRNLTTMECLSKETFGNFLRTAPVTLKTVDNVVYDSTIDILKNNVQQVTVPNAQYISFYHHDNITNMQLKTMTFNDLNKLQKDMNVIIDVRGVFDFDDQFICKRAINGIVNNRNMPLTDIIYKRYLKKIINEDAYEVVYKRIAPKEITLEETKRFQYMPYIHTIGKTKASLRELLITICDSDCSKLTDKKFYEKDESANEYNRVNFVDPISDPKKSIITINTKDCVLDSKNPIEDVLISKIEYKYESESDKYKLNFEFNNPDLWYRDGHPANKQPVTKNCVVVKTEPMQKYLLPEKWINVTDRECNPCNVMYKHDMTFNVGSLSLRENSTSAEYKYTKLNNFTMKGFAKCVALSIKYTCKSTDDVITTPTTLSITNAFFLKTKPMIVIKKKNKEIIARHVINKLNYPIEKRFEGETNTEETFFNAFDIFNNEYDNIVLFVDSGNYSIVLDNLSIILHCEQKDVVEINKCNIYNANLKDCNYETQYYDPVDNFACKNYNNIACEAKHLNKKSAAQVVCESSENYGKTNKILPRIHDDNTLVRSYNDCKNLCDARQGCLGIDFNAQTNKCSFFGYETYRLDVINTLRSNTYNIITYDTSNKVNEHPNLQYAFNKTFNHPVSFKKIIINTNSEFKGTVKLFDYENKLQKEFSNMINDKDTNINHIARYETSPNVFELEFFYTDPEYVPKPEVDEPDVL